MPVAVMVLQKAMGVLTIRDCLLWIRQAPLLLLPLLIGFLVAALIHRTNGLEELPVTLPEQTQRFRSVVRFRVLLAVLY